MRARVLLLTFLLVGPFLSAQEICSNGIDDDGDGLIDLNDKQDCSCALSSTITSLLPNPSLEEFDGGQFGCTSRQPGGRPDAVNQANCLTGWRRASLGTTDAWNAFTFTNAGPFFPEKLPLPLPSGTGVAGFWVGVRDTPDATFTNGDGTRTTQYREYLAACLENGEHLRPGAPYRFTFQLGFMEPQIAREDTTVVSIASPESVELAIYGIRDCNELNFGAFYSCPEASGARGWELITTVTVEGTAGSWTAKQVDFVSPGDYAGFAIGGSCAADNERADGGNYRNYYFIDDLILNTPAAFAAPVAGPVAVDALTACDEEITLTGTAQPGAAYQWFRDGVAIAGATGHELRMAGGPDVDGTYVLRVSTPAGCALTEPVVIQRPILSDHFAETAAICVGADSATLSPRRFTGATFVWSDGSTGDRLTVGAEGTYEVTVTEACVTHTESITVKRAEPFTYSVTQSPARACIGDSVTLSVTTNSFAPRFYFRDLETGLAIPERDGMIVVTAGETREILAFIGDDCGMESHLLYVDALSPLPEPVATITPVACAAGGRIALSVPGTQQATYAWQDAQGRTVGTDAPVLDVTVPGTYTVTITGDDFCPFTGSYAVTGSAPFTASVSANPGNCTMGGSVAVTEVSGTAPYRYRWFYNGAPDPVAENLSVRTDLSAGTYGVEITDASGCTILKNVEVTAGRPVSFTAAANFADCADPLSGTIDFYPTGGVAPYRFEVAGYYAQETPTFTDLPAGTYRLRVTDATGCTAPTQLVTLEEVPVLDLGSDQIIRPGDSAVLSLVEGPLDPTLGTLTWSPDGNANCFYCGDGTSVGVSPAYSTEYRVTYTTAQGCEVTDRVLVSVTDDPRVFVPTAFSPNGDGINDEFKVYVGAGVGAVTDLMVFDRWGELVYRMDTDTEAAWDGTFRGKLLTTGVFAYTGSVQLTNGVSVPLKGSVTLIE